MRAAAVAGGQSSLSVRLGVGNLSFDGDCGKFTTSGHLQLRSAKSPDR